jgi:5,10-methylene-tetrahydrofolate dehydrogenase/methenyl tetrahydrofolate cyclohydrolase
VLVGEDPASVTYVRMKRARCAKAGIESRLVSLPAITATAALVETLQSLSRHAGVHGISRQHPAGPHIDERAAFEAIGPEKDVTEVTVSSFGAMSFGLPGFASCTPGGIMRLLDEYDVDLAGQHAAVAGRSTVLGRPVGMLLLARDVTVTYCRSVDVGRLGHCERQCVAAEAGGGCLGSPQVEPTVQAEGRVEAFGGIDVGHLEGQGCDGCHALTLGTVRRSALRES